MASSSPEKASDNMERARSILNTLQTKLEQKDTSKNKMNQHLMQLIRKQMNMTSQMAATYQKKFLKQDAKIRMAEKEVSILHNKLAQVRDSEEIQTQQLHALQASLDEANAKSQDLILEKDATYHADILRLEHKIEHYKKEAKTQEIQLEGVQVVKKELEQLIHGLKHEVQVRHNREQALETEIEHLKNQNNDLNDKTQSVEVNVFAEEERSEWERKWSNATEQAEEWHNKVLEAQVKINELNTTLINTHNLHDLALQDKTNQTELVQTTLNQVQNQLTHVTEDHEKLVNTNSELTSRIEDLDTQLNQLQQEKSTFESQLGEAEDVKKDAEERLKALEDDLGATKDELTNALADLGTLQTELKHSQEEHEKKFLEETGELNRLLEEVRRERDELGQEKVRLETELLALPKYEAELKELKETKIRQEQELATLNKHLGNTSLF